jgi:TRAP-type C4-dicarboxylate transport system permease small subunit
MRTALERLDRWITWCGLTALVTTVLLTSADALGRYLFNYSLEGAYQITEDYLLALLVFLVLGYSYRSGAHIRVTLLTDRLGERTRLVLAYVAQVVSAACGAVLSYATFMQTVDMFHRGSRASGLLDYPLWPAYAAVFIGCLMMTLLMIADIARVKDGTSGLFGGNADPDDNGIV